MAGFYDKEKAVEEIKNLSRDARLLLRHGRRAFLQTVLSGAELVLSTEGLPAGARPLLSIIIEAAREEDERLKRINL